MPPYPEETSSSQKSPVGYSSSHIDTTASPHENEGWAVSPCTCNRFLRVHMLLVYSKHYQSHSIPYQISCTRLHEQNSPCIWNIFLPRAEWKSVLSCPFVQVWIEKILVSVIWKQISILGKDGNPCISVRNQQQTGSPICLNSTIWVGK